MKSHCTLSNILKVFCKIKSKHITPTLQLAASKFGRTSSRGKSCEEISFINNYVFEDLEHKLHVTSMCIDSIQLVIGWLSKIKNLVVGCTTFFFFFFIVVVINLNTLSHTRTFNLMVNIGWIILFRPKAFGRRTYFSSLPTS